MNGRSTMEYLQQGAASILAYGLIRGREDVIAFGTVSNGAKIRIGSIALQEEGIGYEFLVLSIDNTEEFRATDKNQLYWFLWALGTSNSWEDADAWVNDRHDLVKSESLKAKM